MILRGMFRWPFAYSQATKGIKNLQRMKVTVPTKALYILNAEVVLITVLTGLRPQSHAIFTLFFDNQGCNAPYSHQDHLSIQNMQGFSGHHEFDHKAEKKNCWVSSNPTDPIFGEPATFFFLNRNLHLELNITKKKNPDRPTLNCLPPLLETQHFFSA